MAATN